jgi:hypothetical protein
MVPFSTNNTHLAHLVANHEEAPLLMSEWGWSSSQALGAVVGRVNSYRASAARPFGCPIGVIGSCVLVLSFVDPGFMTHVASLPV